jgi:hypothetical protein
LISVTGLGDGRLSKLREVGAWFQEWDDAVKAEEALTNRALPTRESLDDTQSMVQGFLSLCEQHFCLPDAISIVSARLNSDICENFFCQQRSLHHGANDHPTQHMYSSTINTIILTKSVGSLSTKRNSAPGPSAKKNKPNP